MSPIEAIAAVIARPADPTGPAADGHGRRAAATLPGALYPTRAVHARGAVGAAPSPRASFEQQFARALATTHTVPAAAAGTAAPAGNGAVTGDTVVATARKYLGIPYVWGGTTTSGLDCSGLVQKTFKDLGIDLPRVSRDQAKVGEPVASMADARPGDLIAFGSPVNHIAIYVGDNKILEAPQAGQNVKITTIHRTPVAIRRVVPAGDGTVPAGHVGNVGASVGAAGSTSAAPAVLRWDPASLAAVPRAVPIAALGSLAYGAEPAAAGVAPTASSVPAGNVPGGAVGGPGRTGLTAAQLSAAGLSDAVAAFADQFAAAEAEFQLPPGLLAAVAQAESGGRATAVSRAGAQGLMQLMPATARGLGVADPFDPAQAIPGAAQLLSTHLQAYDGSVELALAAYNAGPGAVSRHGGIPPYRETQNYVRTITAMLARL